MPDAKSLTELQLAVVRVLWQRGEATVADIQTALYADRALALTTVATVLARLEKDGVVTHRAEGRTYWYRALLSEQATKVGMVDDVVTRLFGGDKSALVAHLLQASEITPDDLAKVKGMIAEWETEAESHE
jgi:BlaI family penicillinase repressor